MLCPSEMPLFGALICPGVLRHLVPFPSCQLFARPPQAPEEGGVGVGSHRGNWSPARGASSPERPRGRSRDRPRPPHQERRRPRSCSRSRSRSRDRRRRPSRERSRERGSRRVPVFDHRAGQPERLDYISRRARSPDQARGLDLPLFLPPGNPWLLGACSVAPLFFALLAGVGAPSGAPLALPRDAARPWRPRPSQASRRPPSVLRPSHIPWLTNFLAVWLSADPQHLAGIAQG